MLTREQLAEMLKEVNVEDVAQRAEVSTKTVYRLRNCMVAPTWATVEALVAAVDAIKAERRRKPAKVPS